MAKKTMKSVNTDSVQAQITKEASDVSIPEQIYNELIESLVNDDNFDREIIERLRVLTQGGEIRKSAQVVKVLKKISG